MTLKFFLLSVFVASATAGQLPVLSYANAPAGHIPYAAPPLAYTASLKVATPVAYSAPIAKIATPLTYTAPIAKIATPAVALTKTVIPEDFDHHPKYSYGYDVQDALTGDSKSQHETRDGDIVHGQYSVVDPDGVLRTVDYTADPVNGFNAVVNRQSLHGKVATAKVAAAPVAYAAPLAKVAAPIAYAAPVGKIASPLAYTAPIAKVGATLAYTAPKALAPIPFASGPGITKVYH
ncbi:hypothetical protein WA026_009104 [Henosepilachna vigintioctopunctata]|uniref:Cuticle protein n=1 Tax=Henosepilachna vigintioctopunctata TaxID=420089 RepID=A0AAW1UUR3_9CUCU